MKKLASAFLLSLCFVSQVSAACAWVVWSKNTLTQTAPVTIGQDWDMYDGAETLANCKKMLLGIKTLQRTKWEMKNTKIQDLAQSDGFGVELPNGNHLAVEFHCLPDTVDPRPKSN